MALIAACAMLGGGMMVARPEDDFMRPNDVPLPNKEPLPRPKSKARVARGIPSTSIPDPAFGSRQRRRAAERATR